MYRVTCNGKNLNYGKRGVRRDISDSHYNGWMGTRQNPLEIPFYPHTARYNGSGIMTITVLEEEGG